MVSPSQTAAFATTIETRVLLHGVPVALSVLVHIGHQDGILGRRPRTLLQIPRISENLLWQIHDPRYPPPPPTTTTTCPVFVRLREFQCVSSFCALRYYSCCRLRTITPLIPFSLSCEMKQSDGELLILRT